MNRTPTILAIVIVALLVAACARAGSSPGASGGNPSPSASPPNGGTGAIEHPGGNDPILVIEYTGGMLPVQSTITQLPNLVILGDGRVLMQGAQVELFPGPLMPPLLERTLTEEGIQLVLRAIAETQLFSGDLDLRGVMNTVADAPNTVFRLNAGGREMTVSVYGLGFIDAAHPPPNVPAAEINAHRVLTTLSERLATLDSWLPASAWEAEVWHGYEPAALRLYLRDTTGEPAEPGIPAEPARDWPIDGEDPATFGQEEPLFGDGTRCGAVEGDAAAAWLAEVGAANQLTRWTDGERQFSIVARPLLPHEDPACPELIGAA